MSESTIIAFFQICRDEEIAYQGSFQVLDDQDVLITPSSGGVQFEFRYRRDGSKVFVDVSCRREEAEESSIELKIPINRSKVKWKSASFGEFVVRYRCIYENIRESKALKKLKRRAARAEGPRDETEPNIYFSGKTGGAA